MGTSAKGIDEARLLARWRDILDEPDLDVDTDFFAAGGTHREALGMLTEVNYTIGYRAPLGWCVTGPLTVRRLTGLIAHTGDEELLAIRDPGAAIEILPVRTTGSQLPLFFVFSDAGGAISSRLLGHVLKADRPIFVLTPTWPNVESRRQVVSALVDTIAQMAPRSFHLSGHSIGGVMAYEASSLLERMGRASTSMILVDSHTPELAISAYSRPTYRLRKALTRRKVERKKRSHPYLGDYTYPGHDFVFSRWDTSPPPMSGQLDLLMSDTGAKSKKYKRYFGWDLSHGEDLVVRRIPGNHWAIQRPISAGPVAKVIDQCMDEAELRQSESHAESDIR